MKNFKAETIVSRLFASTVARKQELVDSGSHVAAEFKMVLSHFDANGNDYRAFLSAVENTKKIFDFEPMMKMIGKSVKAGSNDSHYMQMKVVEKIVKFIKALGHKTFNASDIHTGNILMNAMINNGMIKSKTAFSCLVKCEFDALEDQSEKRDRKFMSNYTPGTGSTQLSSTREMFRILGITQGVKGAKDAPIIFTDEAKQAFIEHFDIVAMKVNAPITEDDETALDEMTEE